MEVSAVLMLRAGYLNSLNAVVFVSVDPRHPPRLRQTMKTAPISYTTKSNDCPLGDFLPRTSAFVFVTSSPIWI